MYNTLKEIYDAYSTSDLYKYGEEAEGKTAEEIIEMFKKYNMEISLAAAKEIVNVLEHFDEVEVQKNEIESVSGGCGRKEYKVKSYWAPTCDNKFEQIKSDKILPIACANCIHFREIPGDEDNNGVCRREFV